MQYLIWIKSKKFKLFSKLKNYVNSILFKYNLPFHTSVLLLLKNKDKEENLYVNMGHPKFVMRLK